jgi:ribose transport system permease protein
MGRLTPNSALRVSPIIMTLGMYAILEGGLLVFTHGGASKRSPHAIVSLATGRWGPFPILLVLWIVLGAAALFALSRTVFGRQLYAVGNNAEVAELSGVHVKRVTVLTYVVSGLTAVIAGILLTGYTGTAYLGMGDPYLFASVAAVAIGGASILGGSGHYAGTIAGALTLTILSALLPILNLKPAVLQIIYGLVILLTVGATTVRTRGRT